ncbi:MAG: PqqD family protein [Ruminococcus sp.]|nr:PqqD family protein [Ruminococcus sp.]
MKIKDGFMLRQFGDDYIVVAVGDGSEDFNKLITLNSVGEFIYTQLKKDMTKEELTEAVIDKYEVERSVAERDIDVFLENLEKAGLLDG